MKYEQNSGKRSIFSPRRSILPRPVVPPSFRLLADTSSDPVILFDRWSRVLHGNPPAMRLLGYSPEELSGLHLSRLLASPDGLRTFRRQLRRKDACRTAPDAGRMQLILVRQDGTNFRAETRAVPHGCRIGAGGALILEKTDRILAALPAPEEREPGTENEEVRLKDTVLRQLIATNRRLLRKLREEKESEEALRISEQGLHRLFSRLLMLQETEREQVVRQLHDSIGHSLISLKLGLRGCIDFLDAPPDVRDRIESALPLLEQTVREVREIIKNLRPVVLDSLGVSAALDGLVQDVQQTVPEVVLVFHSDVEEERIPEEIKLPIYRIAQELLADALAYRKAGMVRLALNISGQELLISLHDRHHDPARPEEEIELASIRERAEQAGGIYSRQVRADGTRTISIGWTVTERIAAV